MVNCLRFMQEIETNHCRNTQTTYEVERKKRRAHNTIKTVFGDVATFYIHEAAAATYICDTVVVIWWLTQQLTLAMYLHIDGTSVA